MDVSVVVPTRNRSTLLRQTLGCVLTQRDLELEVVVIDEGSTDDTPALLAALGDPRVRVVRNDPPVGVSMARNRGIIEARGEWVAFLDDDDLWAPDKLARQLKAAREAGGDWVYAGAVNVNDRLEVIHGRPPLPPGDVCAILPRYNPVPAGASNVVVRRAILLRAGPFDSRLRNTEDWEMWIRLSKLGVPAWVRSPLVGYRMHASTSSLDAAQIMAGVRLIEQMHGVSADWGRFYWWIAQLYRRRGQRARALLAYARAMQHGHAREAAADLGAAVWFAAGRATGWTPARIPPRGEMEWREQADRWLRELRTSEGGFPTAPA